MLAAALSILLAAASADQETAPPPGTIAVDPLVVEAYRKTPPPIPPTEEIVRQLNQLVKDEPDRIVCLRKAPLGTRLPRNYCASLRKWYDIQSDRRAGVFSAANNAGGGPPGGVEAGPPYELVDIIREHYRNPTTRAQAEARSRLRAAAEIEAARRAPSSNPSTSPSPSNP